ncbi:MAG: response regulator [Moraxellaceae bacterium]|nr:response regulator [Moraxellaceae bacterium]
MDIKPKVLLVDDEERILRSLGLLLRMQYQVFATSDGFEALAILRREKIHVLISDQRMPVMSGSELLRQAREVSPDTVRILLTGYADADAALASVNEGEIFRYITKPWGPKELRDTIAQAAEIAVRLEGATIAPVVPVATGRLTCLVLDRDEATFQAVQEVIGAHHDVVWRQTVTGALQVLASQPVAILVTELSLGDEDLSAMIKQLKQERPELLTLILTCFKDTSRLVDLINQAQVFRYLPKPVRKGMLGRSIESTIARYQAMTARPVLLATQTVEKTQDVLEQQVGSKVAEYLARLRGKTGRDKTGLAQPVA